ncbi:MAG: SDR family oxidoreductase [Candidatus Hydrogenedentota bacterium]
MSASTIVVTGANSGIGKATVAGLIPTGATIIMACRQQDTGEEARADLGRNADVGRVKVMQADLGSFASTRAFAERFAGEYGRLDVLVNNAATVPLERTVTADGLEAQFHVNHLVYFLLTHLLLDALKKGPNARIVNVASTVHKQGRINFDDLQCERAYSSLRQYCNTKLMNMHFTFELARRLEGAGVTVNCLHPGGVRTNLARHAGPVLAVLFKLGGVLMRSPEGGAKTSIYLAASPDIEGVTGKYFANRREAHPSAAALDRATSERLWKLSSEMTGVGV